MYAVYASSALRRATVEAIFDRMEHALRTGAAPAQTERPMPVVAAIAMRLVRRRRRSRAAGARAAVNDRPSAIPRP